MLFSSETQRNTSTTTYAEAKTAQQLVSSFLNRDRALDWTLDTGSQNALEDYVREGARIESLLRARRPSRPTTSPSSRRSRASAPPRCASPRRCR